MEPAAEAKELLALVALDFKFTTEAIDQHAFGKWDLLDVNTTPITGQSYDAANISAHCSAHAALVLLFLSDEMEQAHPEAAQTINAGFQTSLLCPVEVSDV